jgi:hypothetical protein
MYDEDSKRLKFMLTTAGPGALLAMDVLTFTIGDVSAAVPRQVPSATGSGQTVTETTAPSSETTKAGSLITTTPYTNTAGEPH